MHRLRTVLRDRLRGDDGLTLVELAVAASITGILVAGIASVFTGSLEIVRTVNTKSATTSDVRTALESLTRSLRVATIPTGQTSAFVSASPTAVTFYTNLNRTGTTNDQPPSEVTYSITGGCLRETRTPGVDSNSDVTVVEPPFTYPTSGRVSRCVMRATGGLTLRYFTSGDEITGNTNEVAIASGGVTAASSTADRDLLNTIRSVQIEMTAAEANSGVNGVTAKSRVTLDNVASRLSTS